MVPLALPLRADRANEPNEEQFSPTSCQFAYMVESPGGLQDMAENSFPQLTDFPAEQNENSVHDPRHFDESRVALLDTACTACMHSRAWRLQYEKSLPQGVECQQTPLRKTFHFANGASTEDRLVVWRIPIFLGGYRGEVHSAEVPEGNTPLLLSIAAMSSLDMVIRLKKKVVEVNSLELELPLYVTRTKHLAVQVAFDEATPVVPPKHNSPRAVSEREDLMVYYNEESCFSLLADVPLYPEDVWTPHKGVAPRLEPRGLRVGDTKGQLSTRRVGELTFAATQLLRRDRRMWTALQRRYTLAEQTATEGFQNTVIFEPFGGNFGLTRLGMSEFGWTCSQPLDLIDGYDLLTKEGEELLFRVLREHKPFLLMIAFDCRIWSLMTNMSPWLDWDQIRSTVGRKTLRLIARACKFQHDAGRYFLVENPAGSLAWIWEGLLAELLERCQAKFVIGHQCRYGLVDSVSKKPIRKATGWLSDSEPILNALGKRCQCVLGDHQRIEGGNEFGKRSSQAAHYPKPLCRAICNGILKTMQLDHVVESCQGVFAVGTDEIEQDTLLPMSGDDDDGEQKRDYWKLEGDKLTRVHVLPRCQLFTPMHNMRDLPCHFDDILEGRNTVMTFSDGYKDVHESQWYGDQEANRLRMDRPWTGLTEFRVSLTALPAGEPRVERNRVGEPQPATHRDSAGPSQPESEVAKSSQRSGVLKRHRERTRQLQRGFWSACDDAASLTLLQLTLEHLVEVSAGDWFLLPLTDGVGQQWVAHESASAEVQLILVSRVARRMKKPQPHAGPAEVPLRRSYLLLENDKVLSTSWEEWPKLAPAAQIRPLVQRGRQLYLVLYGKFLGDVPEELEDADERLQRKEQERERQWQVLPRELKQAIKRVHVNLGHASRPAMIRALRVSKASETALKACRLFRCIDCPKLSQPRQPRPSKLPLTDEFNVQLGLDCFEAQDASGQQWAFLNILCQGTTFQVCALLPLTHRNPTGKEVLAALHSHWLGWAGYPERGVITDRARYFLAEVAEDFDAHGCMFETSARASPWQIGQVERHGALWKTAFHKLVYSEQVSGLEEVQWATTATNQAKNAMSRKHGFSPSQWVIGRDIRLPASLADEAEVSRIGAQAIADTPGTKFFRKQQIRMSARQSFAQSANDSALRRAELRQIRPSRGPFHVGTYVFYYDAQQTVQGPSCWRGIARVIGKEGNSTIWISHRGILLAVSPEHLALAHSEEVEQWMVVSKESELVDSTPPAGGTGFIDLRQSPKPPDAPALGDGDGDQPMEHVSDDGYTPTEPAQDVPALPEEPTLEDRPIAPAEDLSSSSTSMARIHLESERAQRRALQSSEFFKQREEERRARREERRAQMGLPASLETSGLKPEEIPIPEGDEFDVELDDYHSRPARQLSPMVSPEDEPAEREAKRLRVSSKENTGMEDVEDSSGMFSYYAEETPKFLWKVARESFHLQAAYYASEMVSEEAFMFGVKRNDFSEKYRQLNASAYQTVAPTMKKKARKEIKLSDLSKELQEKFTGQDGSDSVEWEAWKQKEACEVLSMSESQRVRQQKADLIIPTRWVRTNKHDGLEGKPFKAKSRLVVQGFKDKSLGQYRRDAPTASAMAESLCLAICAYMHFTMVAKDVKNAYFSGRSVNREIYLDQPRGGLPGLRPGQLLRARKAIYGFAEAARMFWLALRDHLLSDGWVESKLEPALFYLRVDGKLKGVLVTHVDDIEGGLHPSYLQKAFQKSSQALEFATDLLKDFIFRGREIRQTEQGHIDVSMRNYALAMKPIKVDAVRKKQLSSDLTAEELELMHSSAGELGWITRQLRCDLAYENGVVQRSKSDACVADLVKLKQFVGLARRGADFRLRYWADVDLSRAVLIHLADSGHANGTPERDEKVRFRSVGGYFLLLANPEILEGAEVRCNVLSFQSSMTKRVCRSTLAAEASHLAEAVEAGDWAAVLLEEALSGDVDLQNWSSVVQRRTRIYVTDARSVYDYLQKDSTSTSSDKRMAIEGALLREAVRLPGAHVRWIDGLQNFADVLTKALADKTVLREFLRTGKFSLVQTEQNRQLKEKKQADRQKRNQRNREDDSLKKEQQQQRRQQVSAEVAQHESSAEENTGM